jgi:choline dehydrogenase-like flavoprotein
MSKFDYVIVGAGAAGCVLANRLSADPGNKVLLIEAGGPDKHPFIHMPKGIAKAMSNPRLIWPYMTQAEPASNGMPESWARGKTLGGSSAVNGMVYNRGQAADYDALAAVSSEDWSWKHIGAAYKALESHELGEGSTRGHQGPLRISMPALRTELTDAAIAAGVAAGLRHQDDVNDPEDSERIGYMPRTIYQGRRQSAAVAFLKPILGRPNLTVVTGVSVDRVLFEGERAVGIHGRRDGGEVSYMAAREVLLCAGALSTPAILQRSGIGPAAHLRKLGIAVRHDSPELGYNLREHRGLVMQWRVHDHASQNRDFQGFRLVRNTMGYYLTRRGPMANGAYEVGAWFRSRPGLERPDGQILIAPFTFDYTSPKFRVERGGGMNMCVYMLRPESTGSVLIASGDPAALPLITPNYASAEADRKAMVDIIRYARKLAQQGPLARYVVEETRPGPQYQTDEEILEGHRLCGYGSYHASGTCRMGKDDQSVLDPQLRVRGVDGLRVVDTSVFPFMPAGNTNGPAMAVAWRAADLILADA